MAAPDNAGKSSYMFVKCKKMLKIKRKGQYTYLCLIWLFTIIGPPGGPPLTSGYPTNPGTVEDLHKKCQNIFPMFFEGAKLLVNKALNSNFQVSHTMTMSNMQPSGYRFGATYVGQKMLSQQEAFPLLLADMDPSGNLNANIMHAPTENTRLKVRTYELYISP